ncbi:MAG: phosphoglycerate kinase [Patescibacteria group bacterium]|nr:phosphoglycerate kinase [Patescibacteria group bacterium]
MLKKIQQVKNLKNKTVLLRTDFNVPLKNGRVEDDYRIAMSLPTIQYLIKKQAKIVLVSHLGRPDGQIKPELSLQPTAKKLSQLLKQPVFFINQNIGQEVKNKIKELKPGQILVIENIRFQPREEKNCQRLAKQLASLADIYVNDAFAVSHRANSSVSAITQYLPSYAGLLMQDEIQNLNQALKPQHPAVAILGGAKISTKIKLIDNLLTKFDKVLLGGALVNNFIQAVGYEVGQSIVDTDYQVKMNKYDSKKLILPIDVKVKTANNRAIIKYINEVGKTDKILDLGPKTVENFKKDIQKAKTIVWNGPLGYFEDIRFKQASQEIVKAILKNKSAHIIIGGGETVSLLESKQNTSKIFISTGGGAMLEFLEGKVLPGIKPLIK